MIPYRARVVSLEATQVVLRGEDERMITLPRNAVFEPITEGQEVVVLVAPLGGEAAGQAQLAQALLNELLSG